jgi:hydroxymethylglutaryl-CoA synthase
MTEQVPGILGWGTYVPRRRLDRTEIRPIAGIGGGKGRRAVASYDEDSVTLAVAAARTVPLSSVDVLVFGTTTPPYAAKTNATLVHAALRLDRDVRCLDAAGAVRATTSALIAATESRATTLLATADVRIGRPGGADEAAMGDAGAAVLVGPGTAETPVLAEVVATASITEEFLERWRLPTETYERVWEDRFGVERYVPLATECWKSLLERAGLQAADVDVVAVSGLHDRAVAGAAKALKVAAVSTGFPDGIGNAGAAQPLLLLASVLEEAGPGKTVVLLSLADGADGVILRTTDAIADRAATPTVAAQVASGSPVSYGRYLSWRGLLPVEPPRRPEPTRVSSSYAFRSGDWKFGFEASTDSGGGISLPPDPTDTARQAMADIAGTVVTFTVDRLAYSPSPPVVFAVVDFDGGGRLPIELTDCDPDEVAIGSRVEMTFRRLYTSEGIHNYFWKARLISTETGA